MDRAPLVLIVEDNPGTAEMLELLFLAEGYTTEVRPDGHAALERLEGPPADLVILDVMMPRADGLEVLRAIRAHADWRETPVIVASARGDDAEIWDGWRAGADSYLVKPYDLEALRATAVELIHTGEMTGS